MICAKCGRVGTEEDERFCVNCGAPMISSAQLPTERLNAPLNDTITPSEHMQADALLGRTIEGKYRLDAKLGVGGMGEVFSATRLHIGDLVAVKILHPDKVGDKDAAERFRREAQVAARLKHPNAVSIYDFGISSDGLMYLVMELVEGHSLRQIIKEHGPVGVTAATEIIWQACAALDEAHRQNVIHRDIKPDNIIVHVLTNGMRVKVLDFGIAKLRDMVASNLTQAGRVMGTPHYMSPEQCMGEELDGRSDIYSLGIVLYEMLCGVVPFNSPTSTAVVVQHVTQPPPSLRSINGNITPAVEAIVLRALDKRREARPQTAGALAEDLRAAVYGLSAAAPPTFSTSGSVAPVTSSSIGMPTMVVSTPVSGSRPVTPYNSSSQLPHSINGGSSASKKFLPYIIAAVLLVVIAGGVAGVVAWFMRSQPGKDQAEKAEPTNRNEKGQTKENKNSKTNPPVVGETPAANSADDQYRALHEKIADATPVQYPDMIQELTAAERKYPTDYRFPYDRARLTAMGPARHEAFHILFEAGHKAIDNDRADEMLSDLARDKDTDFYRLSRGHSEWEVLQNALKSKDDAPLKAAPRH